MKSIKISALASAVVLILSGCGGGGDEASLELGKKDKYEFDNFGNGVKGRFYFTNSVPNSEVKTYTITSIRANQCEAKDIPQTQHLLLPPKTLEDKIGFAEIKFELPFLREDVPTDELIANKCITDKITINYTEKIQGVDFDIKDSKVVQNPSYDQSKVYVKDGDDPLYKWQWHLKNTGQEKYSATSAKKGEDINVESVWQNGKGYTGRGIKVAVVDEGVDMFHPDLNVDWDLSYNFHTGTSNATPFRANIKGKIVDKGGWYDFPHGTSVAGIIAAKGWNGIGTRGVAPSATIVSYNALEMFKDEAKDYFTESLVPRFDTELELQNARIIGALARDYKKIDIYNNSWGSVINAFGQEYSFIDGIEQQVKYGVDEGRRKGNELGKGNVYVKSAGNGGDANLYPENSANGFIIVSSSKADGKMAEYSSTGANVLVNAPGGSSSHPHARPDEKMIVTTDLAGEQRGLDADLRYQSDSSHMSALGNENYDYTQRMNGTSAAAPVVSGVVALMLEANPNLTWRDVSYILAKSAHPNEPKKAENGWQKNAAGIWHHTGYGFGRVDAAAAIKMAKGFKSIGGSGSYAIEKDIPLFGSGNSEVKTYTINVSENKKVEQVRVDFGLEMENNDTGVKTYTSLPRAIFMTKGNNNRIKVENLDDNTSVLHIVYGGKEEDLVKGLAGGASETKEGLNFDKTDFYEFKFGEENNATKFKITVSQIKPQNAIQNMRIVLVSPSGTRSVLFSSIPKDETDLTKAGKDYVPFHLRQTLNHIRLSSVQFLDENSKGNWRLEISGGQNNAKFDLFTDKESVKFTAPKLRIRAH